MGRCMAAPPRSSASASSPADASRCSTPAWPAWRPRSTPRPSSSWSAPTATARSPTAVHRRLPDGPGVPRGPGRSRGGPQPPGRRGPGRPAPLPRRRRHLRAPTSWPARRAGRRATPRLGVFGGPNDTPPGEHAASSSSRARCWPRSSGSGPVRRRYGRPPGRAGRRAVLHPLQPGRPAGTSWCRFARRPRVRRGERRAERAEPPRGGHVLRPPSWSPTTSAGRRLGASPSRCTSTAAAGASSLRREPATLRPCVPGPVGLAGLPARPPAPGRWPSAPWPLLPGRRLRRRRCVAGGRLDRPDAAPPRRPPPRGRGLLVVLHVCYGAGVVRGLVLPWRRPRRPRPVVAVGATPTGPPTRSTCGTAPPTPGSAQGAAPPMTVLE